MKNLHKYYYRDYFTGLSFNYLLNDSKAPDNTVNEIKCRNGSITDNSFSQRDNDGWKLKKDSIITNEISPDDDENRFSLKVQYPGLITGIGISHEVKIEGEFKLGMHFDWTHGMPVIYGSSVKGVLRSYFSEFYQPKEGQPSKKAAFDDIFEGGKKSIYDRDVFFDAVIVKPDKKGRILYSDSITPHGENPLKNPTPLTFLKIAPGCEIQFRFKLVDTRIGNLELKKADKIRLFQEILTTVGIGAKTNVGYGQLTEK